MSTTNSSNSTPLRIISKFGSLESVAIRTAIFTFDKEQQEPLLPPNNKKPFLCFELKTFKDNLQGHHDFASSVDLVVFPSSQNSLSNYDDGLIVTGGGKTLQLFSLQRGNNIGNSPLQHFNSNVHCCRFSPSSSSASSGSSHSSSNNNNLTGNQQQFQLLLAVAAGANIYLYDLSDTEKICSTTNTNNNNQNAAASSYMLKTFGSTTFLEGHRSTVHCVSWSHDSTLLCSASQDSTIRIWDIQDTQTSRMPLEGNHVGPVRACVFSPNSEVVVSAGDDKNILIWCVATGNVIGKLINEQYHHRDRIESLCCTVLAPGKYTSSKHESVVCVASSSSDATILLWDLNKKQPLSTLEKPLQGVHSKIIKKVRFSEDGTTLVSCSSDGSCALYDTNDNFRVMGNKSFVTHRSEIVRDVAYYCTPQNNINTSSNETTTTNNLSQRATLVTGSNQHQNTGNSECKLYHIQHSAMKPLYEKPFRTHYPIIDVYFSHLSDGFYLHAKQQIPSNSSSGISDVASWRVQTSSIAVTPNETTCSLCSTHFAVAPNEWKCITPSCESKRLWQPDLENCSGCKREYSLLRGVLRSHCRCCGKSYCKSCLTNKSKIPYWSKHELFAICGQCSKKATTETAYKQIEKNDLNLVSNKLLIETAMNGDDWMIVNEVGDDEFSVDAVVQASTNNNASAAASSSPSKSNNTQQQQKKLLWSTYENFYQDLFDEYEIIREEMYARAVDGIEIQNFKHNWLKESKTILKMRKEKQQQQQQVSSSSSSSSSPKRTTTDTATAATSNEKNDDEDNNQEQQGEEKVTNESENNNENSNSETQKENDDDVTSSSSKNERENQQEESESTKQQEQEKEEEEEQKEKEEHVDPTTTTTNQEENIVVTSAVLPLSSLPPTQLLAEQGRASVFDLLFATHKDVEITFFINKLEEVHQLFRDVEASEETGIGAIELLENDVIEAQKNFQLAVDGVRSSSSSSSSQNTKNNNKKETAITKRNEEFEILIAKTEILKKQLVIMEQTAKTEIISKLEDYAEELLQFLRSRKATCLYTSAAASDQFSAIKQVHDSIGAAQQIATASKYRIEVLEKVNQDLQKLSVVLESTIPFDSSSCLSSLKSKSAFESSATRQQTCASSPLLSFSNSSSTSSSHAVHPHHHHYNSPTSTSAATNFRSDDLISEAQAVHLWHKEFSRVQTASRDISSKSQNLLENVEKLRQNSVSSILCHFEQATFDTQSACMLLISRIQSVISAGERICSFCDRLEKISKNYSATKIKYENLSEEICELEIQLVRIRRNLSTSAEEKQKEIRRVTSEIAVTRKSQGQCLPDLVSAVQQMFPENRQGLDAQTKQFLESDGICNSEYNWEMFEVDAMHPLALAGEGARNNVYKAKESKSGKYYALKERRVNDKFYKEIQNMNRLKHPYILPLLGAFIKSSGEEHFDNNIDHTNNVNVSDSGSSSAARSSSSSSSLAVAYEVFPYVEGGTFQNFVEACSTTESNASHQIMRVLHQIFEGVQHLHTNGIIHNDLKPDNILMTSKSTSASPLISDFDTAKNQADIHQQLMQTAGATSITATFRYMAPEIAEIMTGGSPLSSTTTTNNNNNNSSSTSSQSASASLSVITPAIDIFAIGIMFAETRVKNFMPPQAIPGVPLHQQKQQQQLRLPKEKFSSDEIDLLSGMLQLDPKKRFTIDQCLRHSAMDLASKAALHEQELRQQQELLQKQQQNIETEKSRVEQSRVQVQQQYEEVRRATAAPLHWKFSLDHSPSKNEVPSSSSRFRDIQILFDRTCKSQYIGQGRDNRGLSHKGYEVKQVFHLENADLWRPYSTLRETLARKYYSSGPNRGACKPLTLPDLFGSHFDNFRDLNLRRDLNEFLLMHGTKSDVAPIIEKSGFDARVASTGLFGNGVYAAANSSKSDEYCFEDQKTGFCCIFLCRVLLGNAYIATNAQTSLRRPPCVLGHEDATMRCDHERTDSVVGVTRDTHPGSYLVKHSEYVVYSAASIYPEYVVYFKRV